MWETNPELLVKQGIKAVVAIMWYDNWSSVNIEKEGISVLKLKQEDAKDDGQMWVNIVKAIIFITQ